MIRRKLSKSGRSTLVRLTPEEREFLGITEDVKLLYREDGILIVKEEDKPKDGQEAAGRQLQPA